MSAGNELIRGYAEAMLSIAKAEGVLPTVEDELYAFAGALDASTPLREALTDAALPAERKRAVVDELLGSEANPVTVNLLGFVVDAGRAREIPRIVEGLAERAAGERSHRLAEIRSAVPLTDTQRDRIAVALSDATGMDLDVQVVVDPSIVGGVVAKIGDEVFDGSLASRLDDVKQQLTTRGA
jgi:F-type H+-transporting ATPase subunit delta